MAIIETKYSVGDIVFYAGTDTTRKQHPCPDCKGEGKWKALSPAGSEFTFSCPRCAARYNGMCDMNLTYTAHVPTVRRLTIGSVQYNTHAGSFDHGARYMCVETGVGGGSVYNEDRLFATEEAALSSAEAMAAVANRETEWVATLYNKTLEISDYQLESAALKLAKDEESRAHSLIWNIGYLFDQIEEAEDKYAIVEAVDWYKKYDWQKDRDGIASRIEAATAGETHSGSTVGESLTGVAGDAQPSPSPSNHGA